MNSRVDSTNTKHNPGTPDTEVSILRLKGREAFRDGSAYGAPGKGQPGRTDWWLGWYDERLKHIFGRE